jgi:hypothetical protein
MFEVSVILPGGALETWQLQHGRALDYNEQYAAAKMRLFEGFDRYDHLMDSAQRFSITSAELGTLLEPLDL